ncbi:hypothetical protein [Streptomyces sp. HPF1205]|uniref:hypothetical protein n=1 Tax=Streptomyces sp. HPF1205 TaxID=2873262 RepID=UPI001CEDB9B7|nr:hypothetical protein [Streptomyces sp. HPF1205]
MPTESADTGAADRRTFFKRASAAAAVPTTGTLLGGFPGTAAAAGSSRLPDYAPGPPASVGPALNAGGCFVG